MAASSQVRSMVSAKVGQVQTVLGLVNAQAIGPCLMHEHLRVDYSQNWGSIDDLPADESLSTDEKQRMWDSPMTIEDAGHHRSFFSQSKDNMILQADDTTLGEQASIETCGLLTGSEWRAAPGAWQPVIEDARRFAAEGGSCIVECSVDGMKCNAHPQGLVHISRETKLHVVMGTGFYLGRTHPSDMHERTIDQLCTKFVDEIEVGLDGIKAGIIGELGCTTDIDDNERRVLQAAAQLRFMGSQQEQTRMHQTETTHVAVQASLQTGASITLHPGYSREAPWQILQVLLDAGLPDCSRVIMGHIDRGILTQDDMCRLAGETGVTLEFDQFGWGVSFQHALKYDVHYPSDLVRCQQILALCDQGFGEQLVASHDIAFKTRMTKFGGHSYDYLMHYCIPYMLKIGVSEEQVRDIFVKNPRRLLAFI